MIVAKKELGFLQKELETKFDWTLQQKKAQVEPIKH